MGNLQVGRPELHPFIVAVRDDSEYPKPDSACPDGQRFWPAEYEEAIRKAWNNYCAGTHEVTQGRFAGKTILYAIPRKKPVGARPWPFAHSGDPVRKEAA